MDSIEKGALVPRDNLGRVKLYDARLPSGNGYKIHLLLSQLELRYEMVDLDTAASETRHPSFLAKNPNGRIPVLELEDGTFLAESNAILFFLASGTRFLLEGRRAIAQTLQWLFFEQYSHEPYIAVLKYWTYWGGLEKCRPDDVARWEVRGQDALNVMENHLARRNFFVDEQYTIADIALFAYTQSAEALGFQIGPAVHGWLDRVRMQPGWVPIKRDPMQTMLEQ